MDTPSPDQIRRTEKAYKDLKKYWYFDINTKEIRRKKLDSKTKRFANFFWKKRHSIWELYWWIKFSYSNHDNEVQKMRYPIQSDNMPLKGFPLKFELINGWTIPKKDLKYLKKGPLASEGLKSILVEHGLGFERIKLIYRQYGRLATTIAATLVIVTYIIEKWGYIVRIFK